MTGDLHPYLAAGQALHPVADWALNQALILGPGLLFGAFCIATAVVCARIRDWRDHRRNLRIHRKPGTDRQLLDACEAAWNADTAPRKENP